MATQSKSPAILSVAGKGKKRPLHKSIGLHAFLIFMTVFAVLPAVITFFNSFKSENEITSARGLKILPEVWTLEPYRKVLTENDGEFLTWFMNSIIAAVVTTVVGLFLSSTAAYALSRYKFPGYRSALNSFLITQMFPAAILMVPIYAMLVKFPIFGFTMLDSRAGLLCAYSTIAVPFCTWMLKGYFDTIPIAIDESGLMDGLTPFGTFWRLVLPLALPGLAVTSFYTFITAWNEVAFANVILLSPELFTLPLGLRTYVFQFDQSWERLSAAAVLVTIPALIVFMSAQRYLVSGLSRGAVKG
ncbi:MAG: sugar ABC transporter permease [Actinomycetales bacterium]